MITILLCLAFIFSPGLSHPLELFNSSLASPNPHPSPEPKTQCSVQVVLADVEERELTTWSPEENCKTQKFQGFPTRDNTLIPENIYQCSNGLTIVKNQGIKDDITQLSAYNPELKQWEPVAVPKVLSTINRYAVTAVPNLPSLFLVGGKVDFNGQPTPTNQICALDCIAYVKDGNKDGSAWTCFSPSQYKLCTPAYDSCATSSNDYVTVINGLQAPFSPVKDVGFYPALGKPPACIPDAVDFTDGVEDCISPKTSEVHAIGGNKMYLMNPEDGSVKPQRGTLPVAATFSRPVRLFYNQSTSEVNVIGGDEDGGLACNTYYYSKKNWNVGQGWPCKAGRVLGTL